MTKLHIKLNLTENEFQQWLTDLGMLHKKRTCDCGREVRKEKEREIGVSTKSIIDWHNFLRDVAAEFCNQNNRMIGGNGIEI